MTVKIIKPTSAQTVKAIKTGNFAEVNKIRETAMEQATEVFNMVASGELSLIYYDMPPVRSCTGKESFLRYILHRSAKEPGKLQLSCLMVQDGKAIPLSDVQLSISKDGIKEFFSRLSSMQKIQTVI